MKRGSTVNQKRQEIIQRLMDHIHNGDIVQNGKLPPERQLAEMMGESRPVLREALIALEALGILDIRDRQGIFLVSNEGAELGILLGSARIWPQEMLSQVMEIRQILDPSVTAIAAIRRTPKDLKRLQDCLDEMEKTHLCGGEEEARAGTYWNTLFHTIIFQSSANTYLSRIYENLLTMTEKGVTIMRVELPTIDIKERGRALEQHRSIAEAIEQSNPEAARKRAQEHLTRTINAMIRLGQIPSTANLFSQIKL